MKKILIIHTGGTISMLENKETGIVSTTGHHPLTALSNHYNSLAIIKEIVEFELPSPQMTPSHMLQLAKRIQKESPFYDGFIVTHGTDTLEETAFFLDLVLDTVKPVIITGAMRSSNEIGSDALYNLISSIRVVIEDQSADSGVLVVMNDEVHTASNVTKTSTSNVATFQSPQYGPIGIVTKESVIFHHKIMERHIYPLNTIAKNVFLLKAYAGMDGKIIEAVHQIKPDGIIIEGLGQGNLPKQTIRAVQALIDDAIPVVLVSRCYQGIVQPTYGYDGGGKMLREMGVIFTNGLTGPKARIKLLIALEQPGADPAMLQQIFAE